MPTPRRAVILFAHGARDARWGQTLIELHARIDAALVDTHVAVAFLEMQPPDLATAVDAALRAGSEAIDVLPVFWAGGGHVANDLPPLLAALGARHPGVRFRVLPVLSELPGMLDFIAAAVVAAQR